MKKTLIKSIVVLSIVFFPFQILLVQSLLAETKPMTLKEAVLYALGEHPTIKAEKMVVQAEKKAVKNARADLLPSLDLTADGGYERVHNTLSRTRQSTGADADNHRDLWYNTQTLSLRQLLYDGSTSISRYRAQQYRAESSKILAGGSAEDIGLRTIESYMDILRARKTIRLATDNIKALSDLRAKTLMRLESGKGTITDVNRVELTLSDAESMLLNQESILQYAQDRFKALTGASPELITRQQTIDLDEKFATVGSVLDIAMKDNKALMAARTNIQQKEADLKSAKGLYHPELNLVFEGTREENIEGLEDTDYAVAGYLRMNFNLFKGGGDVAEVYQNASLLSEARFREDEIMLDIETRIRFEFNNLETANKQIPLLEKKVEQNISVLNSYEEQFLVGKRDIMDVIDAQKMLFNFQSALENMETEKKLAQYRLLTLSGHLFETLDIQFSAEK